MFMDSFNKIIKYLESELKIQDVVTYYAVIKTAEDNDLWNILVAHFASRDWLDVKIINNFEHDDLVEMRIGKKL